jgi:hypothetical protein
MRQKYLFVFAITVFFMSGCKSPEISINNTAATNNSTQPANNSNSPQNTPFKSNENASNSANDQKTPPAQPVNEVCPNPGKPCNHKDKEFADWELSFKMPVKLQPNKSYKSAPFYAIILKRYEESEDCDGNEFIEAAERDRKDEQAKQPERKVFASYGCPNTDAVVYDFEGRTDAKKDNVLIDDFIAIYAGETKEAGEALLQSMKSKYPKATLKQMTAIYEVMSQ